MQWIIKCKSVKRNCIFSEECPFIYYTAPLHRILNPPPGGILRVLNLRACTNIVCVSKILLSIYFVKTKKFSPAVFDWASNVLSNVGNGMHSIALNFRSALLAKTKVSFRNKYSPHLSCHLFHHKHTNL